MARGLVYCFTFWVIKSLQVGFLESSPISGLQAVANAKQLTTLHANTRTKSIYECPKYQETTVPSPPQTHGNSLRDFPRNRKHWGDPRKPAKKQFATTQSIKNLTNTHKSRISRNAKTSFTSFLEPTKNPVTTARELKKLTYQSSEIRGKWL